MTRIFVTGAAGFIGFHVAKKLLKLGHKVVGIDNVNSYYSVELKNQRIKELKKYPTFQFIKTDIKDIKKYFSLYQPEHVIHLAAQAGVRHSILNPDAYVDSNIVGFQAILEACREHRANLVYASSSSVYGGNQSPFSESQPCSTPQSFYAATKLANELAAKAYNHIHQVRSIGLRFFTVYGPWGRPDMAFFRFASAITEGRPIEVYNHGDMVRDFTYIDDIVDGIIKAMNLPNTEARIYNLGRGEPVNLMDAIELLAQNLGKPANIHFLSMQPGDIRETIADISKARVELTYDPQTSIKEGVESFSRWFLSTQPQG